MLKQQIEGVTRESIALKNRIVIEIHTASFRINARLHASSRHCSTRLPTGRPTRAPPRPMSRSINAIRPGMATIPERHAVVRVSSPHSRRGALWDAYRKHFGKDGDPVLVWQAATRDMNPVGAAELTSISPSCRRPGARRRPNIMAQFRSDLETFVLREAVEACVSVGVRERPPQPFVSYTRFCRSERRQRRQLCAVYRPQGPRQANCRGRRATRAISQDWRRR